MRYNLSLLLLWLVAHGLQGQEDGLCRSLVEMGMENVSACQEGGTIYAAWEDPVYRGTFRGLFEVVQRVLTQGEEPTDFCFVVLENHVPQIALSLNKELCTGYQAGSLTLTQVMKQLQISYDTRRAMRVLKGVKAENRSTGKIDFVLYPQFSFNNAWYDKLYGVELNIAPAVEMQLWKGASFTGQVIFPIYSNLTGEMNYIRAGMLVLRQELRLPHNLFGQVSVGNFNSGRMGVDASLLYRTNNDRWALGANAGLTGSSTFYEGRWEVSQWRRVSGSAFVQFNEPHYNMQFKLRGSRYIYGDYGVRADCVRHFGEVSIGLYAMYSGGEVNGGFHFAVPFPIKKNYKRKAVRVRLPQYVDLEYEAQSGNKYAARQLGRYYETRPDENHSQRYYNPDYIRANLVRLAEKEKGT